MSEHEEYLVHQRPRLILENARLHRELDEAKATIARLEAQCVAAGDELQDALERLRYHVHGF